MVKPSKLDDLLRPIVAHYGEQAVLAAAHRVAHPKGATRRDLNVRLREIDILLEQGADKDAIAVAQGITPAYAYLLIREIDNYKRRGIWNSMHHRIERPAPKERKP